MKECNFSQAFLHNLHFEVHNAMLGLVEPYQERCESQIELNFVGALCFFAKWVGQSIDIKPQHQIENFRVDFLITCGERSIIVECDGRDYHHSTRQQIERDRARDARLSELGYKVVRFPGRQLDSTPFGCANDVLSWLQSGKLPEDRSE